MFAILSLESSDGTISFEDIRNLKMVQKAIDSGQLSESLKEIRESRKMWFKVVMLRQKEFLIRKGILLVKKL